MGASYSDVPRSFFLYMKMPNFIHSTRNSPTLTYGTDTCVDYTLKMNNSTAQTCSIFGYLYSREHLKNSNL